MLARAAASLLAVTLAAASLAQAPADVPAATAASLVTVPGLTPVLVRIEDEISCKTSKPGDHFRITVAEDVRVGDAVVIPAGATGDGEVIHAAKPGAGGKAGELIVAARWVQVGGTQVRLRSFALGAVGTDKSVDSLAASFIVGPFALFQKGGVVVIPRDTLGLAKTALEFKLPAVVRTASQPEAPQQIIEKTTEGDVDVPKTD